MVRNDDTHTKTKPSKSGLLNSEKVKELCRKFTQDAVYYICGPASFQKMITKAIATSNAEIHIESFNSEKTTSDLKEDPQEKENLVIGSSDSKNSESSPKKLNISIRSQSHLLEPEKEETVWFAVFYT